MMVNPTEPTPFPSDPDSRLPWLEKQLDGINGDLRDAEMRHEDAIGAVAQEWRDGARNLVHYVTLRRRDLRSIQSALSLYGFSSLGHVEGQVLPSIGVIRRAARAFAAGIGSTDDTDGPDTSGGTASPMDVNADGVLDATARLDAAANRCFGPAPGNRYTRIMVTMPSEAAADRLLLRDLVSSGMNLIRVNCAHDDPETWESIIGLARGEASRAGRPLRVSMDLGGPKLRTGPLAPAPGVVKVKPVRDDYGRVVEPAYAWLRFTDGMSPAVPSGPGAEDMEALRDRGLADVAADAAVVPVRLHDGHSVHDGSILRLTDARGSTRRFTVVYRGAGGILVNTRKTTYLVRGTGLAPDNPVTEIDGGSGGFALRVAGLPPVTRALRLHPDDTLELLRSTEAQPVGPLGPARIGCTLPQVFDAVKPGDRVLFDDGAIEGKAESVEHDRMTVRIRRTAPGGSKLKPEKGINLPDTDLPIAALTEKDREDLRFVAKHADLVNVSFVNTASDVEEVIDLLRATPATERDVGIVLKIETMRAFRNLPQILLAAMRWPTVGVMIARGDLAVEIGFERMAEVQQEILWLCESAGIPVIWATQVLEQLAKKGLPTRAEVTDAAQAQQAEAVMLNKGPFITTAVRTLDDILERMQTHNEKKLNLLRRLESWDLDRPG